MSSQLLPSSAEVQVTPPHAGLRLDVFVSRNISDNQLSRGQARKLCQLGRVLVNGRVASAGYLLSNGDSVRVRFLETFQESGVLCVHYEDSDILVVEKPRGMHSVSQFASSETSLADVLLRYNPHLATVTDKSEDAGLVQRLDFWTSGIVLVAKNSQIAASLQQQLRQGAMSKTYVALVSGLPTQCTYEVNQPIDAAKRATVRVGPGTEKAKAAYSRIRCVAKDSKSGQSLLLFRGASMRRHQVRAHAAFIGFPLVGDWRYGGVSGPDERGFYLHARSICFTHPVTGRSMRVCSNAWQDWGEVVNMAFST